MTEVKLMPQKNVGESMFSGQILMTSNFHNTFGDRCFYIILESLAQIRKQILEDGADYFQVLTYDDKRYWVIDDVNVVTFLLPEDY